MDEDNIIEGEIEDEESLEPEEAVKTPKQKDGDAIVLLNLESLIKSHIANIDKLGREAKEQKETLDSVLNNDATYKEHAEKAKAANQVKSKTRQEIIKRPDVKHVAEKLKSLTAEKKGLEEELPEYLAEYQRLSNSNIITTDDGEERIIISVAKLVKASSQNS
jgi:hypothetical protein